MQRAPQATGRGQRRWQELDRLRGAALLLMLAHHLPLWLSHVDRVDLPGGRWIVPTDIAAPAFTIVAGASLRLFTTARRVAGVSSDRLFADVLRRYGSLVVVGVALRLAIGGPLYAGVLQILGVATVTAFVVDWLGGARLVGGAAVACLVLGPVVEVRVDELLPASSPVTETFAGLFPLVTYLGFVLAGSWLATRRERVTVASARAAGGGLLLVTAALVAAGQPLDRYPGGPVFVVASLAGTALLLALVGWWPSDRLAGLRRLVDSASRHTLGIYVGHYAVRVALRHLDIPAMALPVAVTVALALALAFAAVAPRVPPLPFSLRGRRVAGTLRGT